MKVAVARSRVMSALEKVAKVAPTARAIPILNHVRIDALDPETLHHAAGSLRLSGTDLVSAITVSVYDVAVKEHGSALLPVHEFLTWLRSLDRPYLTLVATTTGVQAQVGPDTSFWKGPPVDQFPPIADLDDQFTHTLPRADLIRALRLVKPAAATSAFHPNLEQVGIRRGKVLAADGIRYHEIELADTEQMDLALPLSFLDDLVILLGSVTDDTINIGIPENRQSVTVRLHGTMLTTARKRETFPDVTHAFLVPAMTNTVALRVERNDLLFAVRRVRVMADPSTKAVRVVLPDQDFSTAVVRAQQPSGAWATETVPVQWAGGARTLVFNHEYLVHLLSLFEEGPLTLLLGEDARHKPSPVLIREGGRSGVLMQLRLDWV